jgi:hypothetical protein
LIKDSKCKTEKLLEYTSKNPVNFMFVKPPAHDEGEIKEMQSGCEPNSFDGFSGGPVKLYNNLSRFSVSDIIGIHTYTFKHENEIKCLLGIKITNDVLCNIKKWHNIFLKKDMWGKLNFFRVINSPTRTWMPVVFSIQTEGDEAYQKEFLWKLFLAIASECIKEKIQFDSNMFHSLAFSGQGKNLLENVQMVIVMGFYLVH